MTGRYLCLMSNKVRRVLGDKQLPLIKVYDDLPEDVEANKIYITGEKGKYFFCTMECPCGCGEVIELSINTTSRPKWSIKWNRNGTISLAPSINRTMGCKSHFFYKYGEVKWCDQQGRYADRKR